MELPNLWLRLLILSLAAIGAWSWYLWGRRSRNLGWASFIFLWLLNLSAFHICRMFCDVVNVELYNNWSLAIHLQAALSLAIVGVRIVRGRV